jgi:hypothetical protein
MSSMGFDPRTQVKALPTELKEVSTNAISGEWLCPNHGCSNIMERTVAMSKPRLLQYYGEDCSHYISLNKRYRKPEVRQLPETHTILRTRLRTKTNKSNYTTQKSKKTSNTDPSKNLGVTPCNTDPSKNLGVTPYNTDPSKNLRVTPCARKG